MGFFELVKRDHGTEVVTFMKQWTSYTRKLASYRNRLIFLHQCKRNGIIPRHIKTSQKNLINSISHENKGSSYIIEKFQKKISDQTLKLEISMTIKMIKEIQNHISLYKESIKRKLPFMIFHEFESRQRVKYNHFFKKYKCKQMKHFENLKRYNNDSLNNLTKQNKNDNFFKNLTNINIPKDIQSFLSLGPKFNLPTTPTNIRIENYISEIEDALSTIPSDQSNIIRAKTTNMLTNFLLNKNRVNYEIESIIKKTKTFLKQEKELIILKADKGNITVALNKTDYLNKMYELLNDNVTYKKIKNDPTLNLERRNNKIINWLKTKGYIDETTSKKLMTYKSVAPKMYGLPKIHKENVPLRPIVASTEAPVRNLSIYISEILKIAFENFNEFRIRDTFVFVENMKNFCLPRGFVLVSFDAKSLFTNISIELFLKIITENYTLIKNCSNIVEKDFKTVIEFIFEATYFTFNNEYYLQIFGTPMGSNISPIIADIVMNSLLKFVVGKVDFKFPFIAQYVDDILCAVPENKLESTLTIFNMFDKDIEFTMETENMRSVPFLDVRAIRTEDNNIIFDWFQKQSNSGRYINYLSYHPLQQKINTVVAMKNRIEKLCNPKFREKNFKNLYELFLKNNFPKYLMKKLIYSTKYTKNPKKQDQRNEITYKKITYIHCITPRIVKLFQPFNIKIASYGKNCINKFYSNMKDKTDIMMKSNVVYRIECADCRKCYVGQTSQRLKNRLTQHSSDIKVKPNSCALTQHASQFNHKFSFNEVKILAQDNNNKRRLFLEMFHIQKSNNCVNFKKDTSNLNIIYNYLFKI